MFDYYVNTLEEYLKDFLNRNDIDCDVLLGDSFAFLPASNTIAYTLLVTDSSSNSFLAQSTIRLSVPLRIKLGSRKRL